MPGDCGVNPSTLYKPKYVLLQMLNEHNKLNCIFWLCYVECDHRQMLC
jgi:hypothetical protein